jgi:ATP-dependent exoDNAse (exonuclease V) alpha subunit
VTSFLEDIDSILSSLDGIEALSGDQVVAMRRLLEAMAKGEKILVLAGAAGTGKTFLMKFLLEIVTRKIRRRVVLTAPTGRAALRLQSVTGIETSTIHRLLYGQVAERKDGSPVFSQLREPCDAGDLLVVDEASMVGSRLHQDLVRMLPVGAQILYVGDQAQLPPVMDSWGPDLDNPTARLEMVHRQALERALLRAATDIRSGGRLPAVSSEDGTFVRKSASVLDIAEWCAEHRRAGTDVVLLTYTNEIRHRVNRFVREQLGRKEVIEPGDRLVSLVNSRALGIMNGELVDVHEIRPFHHDPRHAMWDPSPFELGSLIVKSSSGPFRMHPDYIGEEFIGFKDAMRLKRTLTEKEEWLHVDYGECLTIHKYQGSESQIVGVVADRRFKQLAKRDPSFARRLGYTALTRAREQVVWFDV